MPFVTGALIAAGGSILGGALGGLGARSAGKTQAAAAREAAAIQRAMFDQIRGDLTPYREAGPVALKELMGLSGLEGDVDIQSILEQQPGFKFNLEQGLQAINKGAAARGNFYAPTTLRDLGRFQGGLASNEYGNIWERLFRMSEAGRGASAQTGELGTRAAGDIGGNIVGAGNALAAGRMGAVNAISGGIGDAYNQYLLSTVLGGQRPAYNDAFSRSGGF